MDVVAAFRAYVLEALRLPAMKALVLDDATVRTHCRTPGIDFLSQFQQNN